MRTLPARFPAPQGTDTPLITWRPRSIHTWNKSKFTQTEFGMRLANIYGKQWEFRRLVLQNFKAKLQASVENLKTRPSSSEANAIQKFNQHQIRAESNEEKTKASKSQLNRVPVPELTAGNSAVLFAAVYWALKSTADFWQLSQTCQYNCTAEELSLYPALFMQLVWNVVLFPCSLSGCAPRRSPSHFLKQRSWGLQFSQRGGKYSASWRHFTCAVRSLLPDTNCNMQNDPCWKFIAGS